VKKQTKENIQIIAMVAGILVVILALFWSVITLWNSSEEYEQEEFEVLELKADMLNLNRQIQTMPDKKAVEAVLLMEKRLNQAELEASSANGIQRWLHQSNDILLQLHNDLKERDIRTTDTPQKPIIY
jgi:hypothetical protein